MKKISLILFFLSSAVFANRIDPMLLGISQLTSEKEYEIAAEISEINIELSSGESVEKRVQLYLIASVLNAYAKNKDNAYAHLAQAKSFVTRSGFRKKQHSKHLRKSLRRMEDSIALVEFDLKRILMGVE